MKFIDRLKELLGPQEIKDLAEYGCQQLGPAGLCHYNETMALYDEDGIAEEIWSALYDQALDMGHSKHREKDGALIGVNVLAYLASYGSHDRGGSGAWNVASRASFETMLVWWMADRTAREIATEGFVRMVNVLSQQHDEDLTWAMLPEPFGTLEVKTLPLAPGEEDNLRYELRYRLRDGTRTGCAVLADLDRNY